MRNEPKTILILGELTILPKICQYILNVSCIVVFYFLMKYHHFQNQVVLGLDLQSLLKLHPENVCVSAQSRVQHKNTLNNQTRQDSPIGNTLPPHSSLHPTICLTF